MAILTEKQQKLIKDNDRLMLRYLKNKRSTHSIPFYLEDTFESDLGWYFCIAALKFDELYGCKFSTYAYGAFNMCWKNLNSSEKNRFIRNNYIDSQDVIRFAEKQHAYQEEEKKCLDKEAIYSLIKTTDLTSKERLIMTTYFFDGCSVRKAGKLFKISGARIHQILKKIKNKLKRTATRQKLNYEDFYA